MNSKNLIIAILLVLVAGGAGFFAGMKYQQSRRPNFARNFQGASRPDGAINFKPVAGEILSSDNKSITVKLADGSSKIVLISDSTQINQATTAISVDLKTGITVAAYGTANSDGSVTAQNIQINPQVPAEPVQGPGQ